MVNGSQAWRMLALVGLAECLGMAPWFSASAVASGITADYHLSAAQNAWLTMGVQGGFVAGTLAAALLNLPDLVSARWVFGAGCLGAAFANAMVTRAPSPVELVAWRVATGAALALVYPPGMKIVAGWFSVRRGAALGILIGALTLGKAVPYLLAAVSGGSWRSMMLLASGLAAAGGAIAMMTVRDGPLATSAARFDPGAAMRVLARRGTRLGVLGYLGHMWELYAMWTWVGVYAGASLAARGAANAARLGALAGFVAIAAGAAGAAVAGFLADRHGRARVAAWAMMTSATCCALTVPAFRAPFAVLLILAAAWGFSVVADSAQFSAIVSETTDEEYLGTALTFQTCLGFLLTVVSIRATAAAAEWLGWQWAFLLVMPGPLLGVQAMVALMRPRITRE